MNPEPIKQSLLSKIRIPVQVAEPATTGFNVGKTLLQTAVFWAVFLVVLPWFVVVIERALGFERFTFAGQAPIASLMLLIFSGMGLWSGISMAVAGSGTPLPNDTARNLVISGPYRFVRNPMAIAGLAQGFCVGLWCGSWAIFVYVAAGFFVWNFFVRPMEEAELLERFGEPFAEYRRNVRCWIPRLSAWSQNNAG